MLGRSNGRDCLATAMATVGGEAVRVESSVEEFTVVVEPDSSHAATGSVDAAKLRRGLGDDLPEPRRPGADVFSQPAEVIDGVVEVAV